MVEVYKWLVNLFKKVQLYIDLTDTQKSSNI